MIDRLDFPVVKNRYMVREQLHRQLQTLLGNQAIEAFVNLALGISDRNANYSASEPRPGGPLGPIILAHSNPDVIFRLSQALDVCDKREIPTIIYNRNIHYLKISVGSEISMMLRPDEFWVGNIRTFWTHILVKNQWNARIANEALQLLNQPVEKRKHVVERNEARLEFHLWRGLYLDVEESLLEVARIGSEVARLKGIEPGENRFMWADAIATSLYERRNEW